MLTTTSMFDNKWHGLAVDWNATTKMFNIYVEGQLYASRMASTRDGRIPKGSMLSIEETPGTHGGLHFCNFNKGLIVSQ